MLRSLLCAGVLLVAPLFAASSMADFTLRGIGLGTSLEEAIKSADNKEPDTLASVPDAGIEVVQLTYKQGMPRHIRVTALDHKVVGLAGDYGTEELKAIGSAEDLYARLVDRLGRPNNTERPRNQPEEKRIELVARWVSGYTDISFAAVNEVGSMSATIAVVDLKLMPDLVERRKKAVNVGF